MDYAKRLLHQNFVASFNCKSHQVLTANNTPKIAIACI
jgi:hypothetical protein